MMNNIALAMHHLAHIEENGTVTLVVHNPGPWYAALCPFGSKVPYLDKNGEESLCARGDSPFMAILALNDKLPGAV
jgi:hypothetical protein